MDRLELKRAQVAKTLGEMNYLDNSCLGNGDELLVGQLMTTLPSCIPPETTAWDLIGLIHAKRFRHVLVTAGQNRLVGVISDRDVIRCLGPEKHPSRDSLTRITAADIMSTDLVTVWPNTPLRRAAVLMIDEGISCLPVLADSTLVGIITNTDLHVVLQILLETAGRSSSEESIVAAASSPQN